METRVTDFEMTPDQEAMLVRLRQLLDAPTLKDAVLRSIRIMLYLADSLEQGKHLYVGNAPSDLVDCRKSFDRFSFPRSSVPVGRALA